MFLYSSGDHFFSRKPRGNNSKAHSIWISKSTGNRPLLINNKSASKFVSFRFLDMKWISLKNESMTSKEFDYGSDFLPFLIHILLIKRMSTSNNCNYLYNNSFFKLYGEIFLLSWKLKELGLLMKLNIYVLTKCKNQRKLFVSAVIYVKNWISNYI